MTANVRHERFTKLAFLTMFLYELVTVFTIHIANIILIY